MKCEYILMQDLCICVLRLSNTKIEMEFIVHKLTQKMLWSYMRFHNNKFGCKFLFFFHCIQTKILKHSYLLFTPIKSLPYICMLPAKHYFSVN